MGTSLRANDSRTKRASRRFNRTDMHDRSVFSARISVCTSSVAREAAAFAPPVALSPAVLASPIAPPSAVPVPYASCSTRADSDVAAVACCSVCWRLLSSTDAAWMRGLVVGDGDGVAVFWGCELQR